MAQLIAPISLILAVLGSADPSAPADQGPKGYASVRFLTEISTVPITIDADTFSAWLKPVIAAVESRFPKQVGRKSIVVQITLRRDGPAEIELAGNPKLSDEDVKAIRAAADANKAPRSKVATCSLMVVAKNQPGNPDELPGLTPALQSPPERLLDQIRSGPTREGLVLLKRWATEESLPLLAAWADKAEAKYEGVRNLGDELAKAVADPKASPSVEALALKNANFWRAAMEMKPGNPLTPAIETSLLLAEGRVEWAQQVAAMASLFDAKKSAASAQLGLGRALAEAYLKGVNDRITKGIALHDGGKFAEALAAFDAVLQDDPQSAWVVYERFHTERVMKMQSGAGGPLRSERWPETRARIIAIHPLYQTMGEASGQEGLFDLTRRVELAGLFKDQQSLVKDVITTADIALDLEAFDLAAMLYWSILSGVKSEAYRDRPLLEHFLYALERLGVKDLKNDFKGDHAAAFAAIEADRRKRVEMAFKPAEPDASKPSPKPTTIKP